MAADPVEPDLPLHQTLPDLLRNLLRNLVEPDLALHQTPWEPSPEPSPKRCWTWLCTEASQTFSGTFSGSSLNLRRLHQCTLKTPLALPLLGKNHQLRKSRPLLVTPIYRWHRAMVPLSPTKISFVILLSAHLPPTYPTSKKKKKEKHLHQITRKKKVIQKKYCHPKKIQCHV